MTAQKRCTDCRKVVTDDEAQEAREEHPVTQDRLCVPCAIERHNTAAEDDLE